MHKTRTLAAIAWLAFASATAAAQGMEAVTPDRARANFARAITLAADDVRAFAPPPTGFADAQPGAAAGRI